MTRTNRIPESQRRELGFTAAILDRCQLVPHFYAVGYRLGLACTTGLLPVEDFRGRRDLKALGFRDGLAGLSLSPAALAQRGVWLEPTDSEDD